jgi:hypothetical protein
MERGADQAGVRTDDRGPADGGAALAHGGSTRSSQIAGTRPIGRRNMRPALTRGPVFWLGTPPDRLPAESSAVASWSGGSTSLTAARPRRNEADIAFHRLPCESVSADSLPGSGRHIRDKRFFFNRWKMLGHEQDRDRRGEFIRHGCGMMRIEKPPTRPSGAPAPRS